MYSEPELKSIIKDSETSSPLPEKSELVTWRDSLQFGTRDQTDWNRPKTDRTCVLIDRWLSGVWFVLLLYSKFPYQNQKYNWGRWSLSWNTFSGAETVTTLWISRHAPDQHLSRWDRCYFVTLNSKCCVYVYVCVHVTMGVGVRLLTRGVTAELHVLWVEVGTNMLPEQRERYCHNLMEENKRTPQQQY